MVTQQGRGSVGALGILIGASMAGGCRSPSAGAGADATATPSGLVENVTVTARASCTNAKNHASDSNSVFLVNAYTGMGCQLRSSGSGPGDLLVDLQNSSGNGSAFQVFLKAFAGPGQYDTAVGGHSVTIVAPRGTAPTCVGAAAGASCGPGATAKTNDAVQPPPPQCKITVMPSPTDVRSVAAGQKALVSLQVSCPALQVAPTPEFFCAYQDAASTAAPAAAPMKWNLVANCTKAY